LILSELPWLKSSNLQAALRDYRQHLAFLTVTNNASRFFASLVYFEQNSRVIDKKLVSP